MKKESEKTYFDRNKIPFVLLLSICIFLPARWFEAASGAEAYSGFQVMAHGFGRLLSFYLFALAVEGILEKKLRSLFLSLIVESILLLSILSFPMWMYPVPAEFYKTVMETVRPTYCYGVYLAVTCVGGAVLLNIRKLIWELKKEPVRKRQSFLEKIFLGFLIFFDLLAAVLLVLAFFPVRLEKL